MNTKEIEVEWYYPTRTENLLLKGFQEEVDWFEKHNIVLSGEFIDTPQRQWVIYGCWPDKWPEGEEVLIAPYSSHSSEDVLYFLRLKLEKSR